MQRHVTMRYLCAVLSIMIVIAAITSAAPSYGSDYDNSLRDLWEILLQKEALEDKFGGHQIVRKSSRSPSLRLRFGRRSDPNLSPEAAFLMTQEAAEHEN